jgi:hypothetical protein
MDLLRQISEIRDEFKGNPSSFEQLVEAGVPRAQMMSWENLETFLWRRWWSRAWVIQEICLAPDAEMHCGDYLLPAKTFFLAISFMAFSAIPTATGINLGTTPYIAALHMGISWNRPRPLLDLLLDTRSYEATDKRDKIFALLGLCNTPEALLVNPGYSASVAETYKSFAIEMIKNSKSLDILTAVCDSLWRGKPFLPSWVPDWTCHPRLTEFLRSSEVVQLSAAASSKSHAEAEFSGDGKALILKGIVLDKIDRTYRPFLFRTLDQRADVSESIGGPTWYLEPMKSNPMETIVRMAVRVRMWEKAAMDSASKSKLYGPTGEPIMTAFLRTLAGGQILLPETTGVESEASDIVEPAQSAGDEQQTTQESEEPDAERSNEPTPNIVPDSELESYYDSFCAIHLFKPRVRTQTKADLERYSIFSRYFYRACWGRTFAIGKEHKYLCLASYSVRAGDVIVLLAGGRTPYLMRRLKKKGQQTWELVGECFVHGAMNGEKWSDDPKDQQRFEIV